MGSNPRRIADNERKATISGDVGEVRGEAKGQGTAKFETAMVCVQLAGAETELLKSLPVMWSTWRTLTEQVTRAKRLNNRATFAPDTI